MDFNTWSLPLFASMMDGGAERGEKGDQGQHGQDGAVGIQGPQGEPGRDAPIHPWRWTALTIWIVIFTIVVGMSVRTNRELAGEGKEAKEAICVFVDDLERRIAVAEEFLKNNPGPVVLGNVPRTTIESNLQSQKRTYQSFEESGLDCT